MSRVTFSGDVMGPVAAPKTFIADFNKYAGQTMSVQNTYTIPPATAKTFTGADVDIVENRINFASPHGWATGRKVTVSTAGTLPDPLAAGIYYVIPEAANYIKLASSQADALAKIAIDLTTQGIGTSTLTPAALAGAQLTISESNDGVNWVPNDDFDTAITVDGAVFLKNVPTDVRYQRISFAITDGQVNLTCSVCIKD